MVVLRISTLFKQGSLILTIFKLLFSRGYSIPFHIILLLLEVVHDKVKINFKIFCSNNINPFINNLLTCSHKEQLVAVK